MKLIVGLGNVGEKYCFTRHNAGFMAVDKYAINNNMTFSQDKRLKCFIAKSNDIMLIKPTTFMNLSGEAVKAVIDYYKINIEDILVIFDDLSLDIGRLRFRKNGSDGGHNGIKSIIQHLNTQNFARLKIGIGPQPNIPAENFVLQNFSKNDLEVLKETLNRVIEGIDFYFNYGIEQAQNKFNS